MNPGTRPKALPSEPDLQMEYRRQIRAWRELLARCGRKPGRKYVHKLRVATLRLQAALEFSLSCMDADASPARWLKRCVRQAKKLRHALGPVRQADVSLDKLAAIKSWAEHPAGASEVVPKKYLGAIEKIERTVRRRRKAAAKEFVSEFARRCKRLNRLSRILEKAPGSFVPKMDSGLAGIIHSEIAAAAAEFPVIETQNFHRFRKRIKKIRYLAEVFAPLDSAAARKAPMLKRMTGAIGEWHDWQVLAEEAERAGRKNSAAAAAAKLLRSRAQRSFQDARNLCTGTMARLLNRAVDGHGRSAESARNPAGEAPRKAANSVSPVPGAMHAERPIHASKLAN